jgi:hypothetical protein
VTTFRYQIQTASGERLGIPFLSLTRCLDRVRFENLCVGEWRYTIKPVRVRG